MYIVDGVTVESGHTIACQTREFHAVDGASRLEGGQIKDADVRGRKRALEEWDRME
ncbi:MAG: hypothetical protein KFF77_05505 [Bacteroidetes bacterium]|nr:hypothetical protein [Bacteroidota bacterium]